jgi:secreted trypsin-like serine protease
MILWRGLKNWFDLHNLHISSTVCGKNKLKPTLTKEMLQMININQVAPKDDQLCTSVLISDRFALTAAHCWGKFKYE